MLAMYMLIGCKQINYRKIWALQTNSGHYNIHKSCVWDVCEWTIAHQKTKKQVWNVWQSNQKHTTYYFHYWYAWMCEFVHVQQAQMKPWLACLMDLIITIYTYHTLIVWVLQKHQYSFSCLQATPNLHTNNARSVSAPRARTCIASRHTNAIQASLALRSCTHNQQYTWRTHHSIMQSKDVRATNANSECNTVHARRPRIKHTESYAITTYLNQNCNVV